MSEKVFVQEVMVFWTKASRGAPQSAARSRCPEAFALSPDELAQFTEGDNYSSVVMRESEAFRPDQHIGRLPQGKTFQWPSLSVMFLNREIVARYEFADWEGAPSRAGRPAITHLLTPDKLLRVQYNSRDSWPTGEWHYRLTTFNILLTDTPSTEMFLATPEKCIADIEDLW